MEKLGTCAAYATLAKHAAFRGKRGRRAERQNNRGRTQNAGRNCARRDGSQSGHLHGGKRAGKLAYRHAAASAGHAGVKNDGGDA